MNTPAHISLQAWQNDGSERFDTKSAIGESILLF
jgi:hypothetical protein